MACIIRYKQSVNVGMILGSVPLSTNNGRRAVRGEGVVHIKSLIMLFIFAEVFYASRSADKSIFLDPLWFFSKGIRLMVRKVT